MEQELKSVICPYDKRHIIHDSRFIRHILKCAKRFPPKYKETCPFNARHIMSRAELEEHIAECPNRIMLAVEYDFVTEIDDDSSMADSNISQRFSCSSNASTAHPCCPKMFRQSFESAHGSNTESQNLLPFGRGLGARNMQTVAKFPAFGRGNTSNK